MVDARNRLQARKATLNTQMQEWQDQLAHCTEQIAELEEEMAAAAERAAGLQEDLESRQEGMPAIEERVRSASGSREAMRSELARVEQKLALTAQAQRDADRQLQQLEQRRERLERERSEIQSPEAGKLEQLAGDRNAAEAQLEEVQATLQDMEDRLPQLDQARREAQQNAQKESQEVARLEARLGALSALQEDVQKQGTLEPWLQKHELGSFTRLWQQVQIEAGWEAALESALRERLTALPLRDLDMARAFTDDPPPSRLAFYQKPTAEALPAGVPGLTPLLSLVRCADPDLKSLLGRWLQGIYTAPSLAQALAQRSALPMGVQLVVREGHMTDAHGICFYAADSEQAGMLARQQEMENLQREIKARQLISDQAVSQLARSEAAWTSLSQSMAPARQRLAELTRRTHDLQMEHSRLHAQIQQSDERSARIQEDLADIAMQQEELLAQKEESETGFEALDNELATLQENYAEAEMAGESLAEEAEQARQLLRELERNVQEAGFQQRGLASRIADLTRNRGLASNQINQARNELENLEAELFDFDESATQAGLQDALEARAVREEALAAARLELDNLAATLRGADETRMRTEQSLEPRRARIMQLQLDEQAARLAVEQFSEQLDQQEVDRAALKQEMNDLPDEWSKVTWLASEVQKISRQVEALGSVNLAALDELNEARERKGFLDAQHADLSEAINTLEDAIRKIDRETRELLQETFNQVNAHFGDLFPRLFGGGEAKLSMTGEEILDAGVQVMAQPPGKRNSTIHLLSGGEKALTATALVFALFKLNPAPFCLLDEVDAPLDDANTERYANLVGSMSDQTQFLFISHNKIAMQMAKQLIGVTMQEQGVSRIVAVDIESAVQLVGEA